MLISVDGEILKGPVERDSRGQAVASRTCGRISCAVDVYLVAIGMIWHDPVSLGVRLLGATLRLSFVDDGPIITRCPMGAWERHHQPNPATGDEIYNVTERNVT